MKVRQPSFDLAGLDPVWARNRKLTHTINATGIVPAYIEPYLIKVMRQAKERLDPIQHPDLVADLDTFIRQEAQHYKAHGAFNKAIRDNGYGGMKEYEEQYAADLQRFLDTKSFEWNLAHCEGFEALGSAGADDWIDGRMEAALGDPDPRPLAMWQWHVAEEYEHRTVVFRTYQALFARRPLRAYIVRVWGYFFAVWHIQSNVARLAQHLEDTDRQMRGEGPPKKQLWPDAYTRNLLMGLVKKALKVMSPFYDPQRIAPSRNLRAVLDAY